MIDRRSLVRNAMASGALLALPALPDPLGLTAEEEHYMAMAPDHVGAEDRALILGVLRDPNPHMRRLGRMILEATPAQLDAFLAHVEARLGV